MNLKSHTPSLEISPTSKNRHLTSLDGSFCSQNLNFTSTTIQNNPLHSKLKTHTPSLAIPSDSQNKHEPPPKNIAYSTNHNISRNLHLKVCEKSGVAIPSATQNKHEPSRKKIDYSNNNNVSSNLHLKVCQKSVHTASGHLDETILTINSDSSKIDSPMYSKFTKEKSTLEKLPDEICFSFKKPVDNKIDNLDLSINIIEEENINFSKTVLGRGA